MPSGQVAAFVDQRTQIGQEADPGVNAACNRKLLELMFSFQDQVQTRQVRPQGHRFDTDSFTEMRWTDLKASGPIDYYEQHILLESMVGAATPTIPVGGTNSRERLYDVAISGSFSPKSFTAQWGDSDYVNEVAYIVTPTLGGTYSRDKGGDFSGACIGRKLKPGGSTFTNGATPYGASPYETHPLLGSHLNFYLDTTSAGLGATQLPEEVLDANWNIADLFKPFWAADRAQTSWKRPISNEGGKYTAQISFGEDDVTRGIVENMVLGQTYFFRIEAVGDIIEGSLAFLHQVDLALKYVSSSEWKNAGSVYARDLNFTIVEDQTWGHACQIKTRTDLSSL